jgi:hypothetical protein
MCSAIIGELSKMQIWFSKTGWELQCCISNTYWDGHVVTRWSMPHTVKRWARGCEEQLYKQGWPEKTPRPSDSVVGTEIWAKCSPSERTSGHAWKSKHLEQNLRGGRAEHSAAKSCGLRKEAAEKRQLGLERGWHWSIQSPLDRSWLGPFDKGSHWGILLFIIGDEKHENMQRLRRKK